MKLSSSQIYKVHLSFLMLLLFACNTKQKVQLLVQHAKIYTVDSAFSIANVMVVDDGKIVAVGNQDLLNKYDSDSVINLNGKFVYPGFNDAHSHFYGLGLYAQTVDLTGTKNWDEVLQRCVAFNEKFHPNVLLGRGWDQNDWAIKSYPDNKTLSILFPSIPVLLKRVDGHAAIANQAALHLASVGFNTTIEGGELVTAGNQLTGVLIDNAVDLVQDKLPKPNTETMVQYLTQSQAICFANGLTSVCDAGLDPYTIHLIDSLQQQHILSIRVYAMLNATDENLDTWLKKEPLKTEQLNVSSFKVYADGALGSRGACMLQPYSDRSNHFGLLLTSKKRLEDVVKRVALSKYQLNTHCIGDSANRLMLNWYGKYLPKNNDRRWRIEHAQVVNESDFDLFGSYNIIPSVQPVHATSDMYWAEERLGKSRLMGAYALKKLLNQNGWLPLGTDFPVESPNPLHTFYAAVARKDNEQFPPNGFQPENALTRTEALKGITIWPAKAAFEDEIKGTLEPGKLADFMVLDVDLMNDSLEKIRDAKVYATYVNGKCVSKIPLH